MEQLSAHNERLAATNDFTATNDRLTATNDRLFEQAAEAFRQWRGAKSGRGRIPDELWDLACQVARRHGVAKTAGALKLDYYTLQRRLDGRGGARGKAVDTPKKRRRGSAGAFVELAPVTNISPQAECELEFENGRGTKLTLRWKGSTPPDLAALSQLVRQE
ncbi:MAG: hypothetical protein KatS3mg082_3313 [Nitrospiraceae bacterium]|nr:MAG: hypothetical protein KatS3mg082_3306 [Nitrospiraceae bacterium]GIW98158.1 MAG: hypothetical protein KatS3mg111_1491 [Pirellulaceae bacterium]GIW56909.1 MAG: hypothetical protein KatS3mg082_3313 [Nitrospiraceae bacterium]GIW98354.1 MAG: hypothetical protein KatS3mg111_1687 [Pirellulaceae bacterium]GIW98374.1 MAG: hypothetical protein KatS3mg111_1707 [Pirellulaceae bacterium]